MSREGWVPEIGPGLTIEAVVEHAFDYRGNTTIVRTNGTEVVGYVFNRDAAVPDPFIEYFDEAGEGPFRLRYREIATIKFTGKDTAAGNSWKAWVERREREKAAGRDARPTERTADPDRRAVHHGIEPARRYSWFWEYKHPCTRRHNCRLK
jgi:hypothetical protein